MSSKRLKISPQQSDIEQVLYLVATHCRNAFLLVNRAIYAKARELGPLRTSYRWLTASTLQAACDYGLPRDTVSDHAVALRDPALLAEALQRGLPGFTSISVFHTAILAGLFPDVELIFSLNPRWSWEKLVYDLVRTNQLLAIQSLRKWLIDSFAFLAVKGSDSILDWAIEQQAFVQERSGYGAYPDQCKIWSQDGYMQVNCSCLDCAENEHTSVLTLLDKIASHGWRRFSKYLPRLRKWTLHSVCRAFKSSAPDRLVLVRWLLDQRPEIGWALPCLVHHIAELDAATASWLFADCRPALLQMTDNWSAVFADPKILKAIPRDRYLMSSVRQASFNLFAVIRTLIQAGNIPMLEFFVSVGFKWTAEYYYTAAALNSIRVLTWARQRFLVPSGLTPAEFVHLRQPENENCHVLCYESKYSGAEGMRWLLAHRFPMDNEELFAMLELNMIDELVAQLESVGYFDYSLPSDMSKFNYCWQLLDENDCRRLVQMAKQLDRLDWLDRLSTRVKANFITHAP